MFLSARQECLSLLGIPLGLSVSFKLASGDKEKEKDRECDKDKDKDPDNIERDSFSNLLYDSLTGYTLSAPAISLTLDIFGLASIFPAP
jgi:hypothetical protein